MTGRRTVAPMGKWMMMAPSSGRLPCFLGKATTNANPLLRQRKYFSSSTCPRASPSSSLSSTSASIAEDEVSFQKENELQPKRSKREVLLPLVPRIDEPNLFDIPVTLRPTYGRVPFLIQAIIVVISTLVVERRSLSRLLRTTTSPLSYLVTQTVHRPLTSRLLTPSSIRQLLVFALRTAFLSILAILAVQERFFPPSRVTTSDLATRGELPSKLSEYSSVMPVAVSSLLLPSANYIDKDGKGNDAMTLTATASWNDIEPTPFSLPVPIGVHSIQYQQSTLTTANTIKHCNTNKYDGIYLHHGFGASSLSWLPILPSLVDKLGNGKARGIAHDAPGFGFTDRPDGDDSGGFYQYGTENNVGIGLALLNESLFNGADSTSGGDSNSNSVGEDETKSIAIFGHSMGCKAALLMALCCHFHKKLQLRPSLVVLVAPALEGLTLPSNNAKDNKKKLSGRFNEESKGWVTKLVHNVWVTWRKIFLDYPFQYGLRRLVW